MLAGGGTMEAGGEGCKRKGILWKGEEKDVSGRGNYGSGRRRMLAGGGTMEAGAESGAKEAKGGMMEASAIEQLLSIYFFTDILKNDIFRKASSVNHYLRTSYLPSSGNAPNQTKK